MDLVEAKTEHNTLPPVWLCIDRYRDRASVVQRMSETREVDVRVLDSTGQSPAAMLNRHDPTIRDYILASASIKSYAAMGEDLGVDSHSVQTAYNWYMKEGLCGPKPRVSMNLCRQK